MDDVGLSRRYTCTMDPILAIFENGVFRPLEPVSLAEGTQVQVTLIASGAAASEQSNTWPPAYFDQTAGAFDGEVLDRAKTLEAIEDRVDLALAKKALKEKGRIPWQQAKKSLGL